MARIVARIFVVLSRSGTNASTNAAEEIATLRRQVESLEAGLLSSRLIGAAVGLVMAEHQVSRSTAFAMLRAMSQNSNTRLAAVAAELVAEADRRADATGQEYDLHGQPLR